jgi:putative transposase
MDFVMDALSRRIKLNDFMPDGRCPGVQVTRILDSIALFRGYPATIRTQVHLPCTGSMGLIVIHLLFNGRFRDECLNEHWFSDIVHARKIINDWRQDYNECRPHSTLNYQTPSEFAIILDRRY